MNNQSAIHEMFLGKRGNFENIKFGNDYSNILGRVCECENEIVKELEKIDCVNLFKRYEKIVSDLQFEELCTIYTEGFKFGVRIGMEILSD